MDDWNPMSDAFNSVWHNSYSSGQTGANLPVHLLPPFGGQLSRPKTRENVKLYIDGFPSDVTESGLKGYLQRIGCKPSAVKRVKTRLGRYYSNHEFGISFVDFNSYKEALNAIQLIRSQSLFKLSVGFATTEADKQQKDFYIDKEKEYLLRRHLQMKPKLDIGDCAAINANNRHSSHSNGHRIESDNESHESSHLEVLSPLAKSDKLLKVLNTSGDECSFCNGGDTIEHLHFILDEQQVIDPKQLPALIAANTECQKCGQKSANIKLCSQCKTTYYCGIKCQSSDWVNHKKICSAGAVDNTPRVVSSTNASLPSVPTRERTRSPPPTNHSVSKPKSPIKESNNCDDSLMIVEGSPKVTFNKSSVSDVTDGLSKRLNFDESSNGSMKSFLEYKHNNTDIDLVINDAVIGDNERHLATIFDPSIGRIIHSLPDDYINELPVVPKAEDLIVAKYPDGQYFRAYVLEVHSKSAKVFLIDDSIISDVDFSRIYQIKAKYLKAPSFGVLLVPDSREATDLLKKTAKLDKSILRGAYVKRDDKFFAQCDDH
ncbi:unnamed protein product, partial [Oppiella nova]